MVISPPVPSSQESAIRSCNATGFLCNRFKGEDTAIVVAGDPKDHLVDMFVCNRSMPT